MKVSIPRVILYKTGSGNAEQNFSITLPDKQKVYCLFSTPLLAIQYQENSPHLKAETGWKFGPMNDSEFRQFLHSLGDNDLIARDPQPSDKNYYCIEVSQLRKLFDDRKNDTENAEFELHAVASS